MNRSGKSGCQLLTWGCSLGLSLLLGAGCSSFRQQTMENRLAADQLAVRGQEALRCGQNDQAIRLLYGAVDKKPNDVTTRIHLVEALADCGRLDAAIEQLQIAIDRSQPQPQLLVRLAELYAENGQLARAKYCTDQALNADPHSVAAWRLNGDIVFGQGDLNEALAHYQKALSYDSQAEDIWLRIAEVYRRTDRSQRAFSTLENLVQRYPVGSAPADWIVLQGELLAQMGQAEQAVELLNVLADREDAPVRCFLVLSHVQGQTHGAGESQAVLLRGQQRFPDDPQLANALAQLQAGSSRIPGLAHLGE